MNGVKIVASTVPNSVLFHSWLPSDPPVSMTRPPFLGGPFLPLPGYFQNSSEEAAGDGVGWGRQQRHRRRSGEERQGAGGIRARSAHESSALLSLPLPLTMGSRPAESQAL